MELDALDEVDDLDDSAELSAASSEGAAAALDMDWDDDDNVKTRQANPFKGFSEDAPTQVVRNPALALEEGQPSPFPDGQPSPFGAPVSEPSLPAVDPASPDAYPSVQREPVPAAQVPTAVDMRGESPMLPLGIGAAVVAVLLGWLLLGGTEPGTATLAVAPVDAKVSLDGTPVEGSSPYTLLEIEPEVPHTLVVSADGYEPQTTTFTLADGEMRGLPEISLVATARDTGFALASTPPGLKVSVDGVPTPYVTPARVLGVAPGMHTVRLDPPAGYAPFEIKVFVSDNQVLELAPATLAKAAAPEPVAAPPVAAPPVAAAPAPAPVAVEAPAPPAPAVEQRSTSSAAAKARRAKRRAARRAKRRAASAGAPAPATTAGGGTGTLRVNTRPWSKVFVDGRLIGNTPQFNIKLKAGSHTVKLVNDQMGLTKRIKVRVNAGQTVTKVVNLIN